jgi:hypothetical protein
VKGVERRWPGCKISDTAEAPPSEEPTVSVAVIAVILVLNVGVSPAFRLQVQATAPRSGKTTTVSRCFVLGCAGAVEALDAVGGGEVARIGVPDSAAPLVTFVGTGGGLPGRAGSPRERLRDRDQDQEPSHVICIMPQP